MAYRRVIWCPSQMRVFFHEYDCPKTVHPFASGSRVTQRLISRARGARLSGTRVARCRVVIAHELQGFVSLKALANILVIRQTECDWLRLEGFRDVTAWIYVSEFFGNPSLTIDLET